MSNYHKSGNKIVDDFIRNTNIRIRHYNHFDYMIEFVPYDQFKDIMFIAEVDSYAVTWINGNIQSLDMKNMSFKRSDPIRVVLKKLKNITSKELNEVHILIIIYLNNTVHD